MLRLWSNRQKANTIEFISAEEETRSNGDRSKMSIKIHNSWSAPKLSMEVMDFGFLKPLHIPFFM